MQSPNTARRARASISIASPRLKAARAKARRDGRNFSNYVDRLIERDLSRTKEQAAAALLGAAPAVASVASFVAPVALLLGLQ